jgi:hypothetical protein
MTWCAIALRGLLATTAGDARRTSTATLLFLEGTANPASAITTLTQICLEAVMLPLDSVSSACTTRKATIVNAANRISSAMLLCRIAKVCLIY